MIAWWQNLSVRERIMVAGAVVVGVLYLVYQFTIIPLGTWSDASKERLRLQQVGYEQVKLAARMHGGKALTAVPSNPNIDLTTPLKQVLDRDARQAQLVVSSIAGEGDRNIEITLAAAEPERLYQWLASLRENYGAIVVEARMSRARNNPALVKVDRLIVSRTGPR